MSGPSLHVANILQQRYIFIPLPATIRPVAITVEEELGGGGAHTRGDFTVISQQKE
jgi:hypothetical protein